MSKWNNLVTRGVANIISDKESLIKLLDSGKKLNVYLGIDPTATKIHLGHAVSLRKLKEFTDAGHNVTFLIGDFTALIGDASDKDSERPLLNREQIEQNFATYKKQAEKILDFSKVSLRFNSEWLGKLNFSDVLKLSAHFSVGDFIARELIKKRLSNGKRVGLQELLYPMMQGFDSLTLDTDIQVGGTDQTFNMQSGRTLIKNLKNKDSFVLTTQFLTGTDGRKMSKSWGNAIWIEDNAFDMYAKIMSINDNLIIEYYTLATNLDDNSITEIKSALDKNSNPMDIKKDLALNIVTQFAGRDKADEARAEFEKTVQGKNIPSNLPVKTFTDKEITFLDLLLACGFAESKTKAKTLIEQNSVSLENQIVRDPKSLIRLQNGQILRVGKRFLKIKVE